MAKFTVELLRILATIVSISTFYGVMQRSKRGWEKYLENSAHAGRYPYASFPSRRLPPLGRCPPPNGNVPGQRSVQILQLAA